MEVEEALRTLRLLRTTTKSRTTLRLLGLLHLRSFGHEVDGVLASQSFHIRNQMRNRNRLIGRSLIADIDDANFFTLPGIIQLDMNLKGTLSAIGQVQVEMRIVAFLHTFESLTALRVLGQTSEAEILEADDAAILNTGEVHRIVPHVVVILHILVGIRTIHEAGQTSRVVGVGRQTVDLEALAGHLGTGVFVAVAGLRRPHVVLGKCVIAGNGHLTTLGHRLLVPRNLHRCHHSLTGIAEATWWTVIEHVPLAVDFLQRTVGVMAGIGGDELRAVLVEHHATRVDQHATRAPRTQRRVAVGIAQGGIGVAQSVLLAAVATEHHHVLVAHLANRRSLKEVEVQRVLTLIERLILTALLV